MWSCAVRRFDRPLATALAALVLSTPGAGQGSGTATPDWVRARPSAPGYLVGIGAAADPEGLAPCRSRALVEALGDLALQLGAQVSGETAVRTRESGSRVEVELAAVAQASTQARIEGAEIVDTWRGRGQCWAYVRLWAMEPPATAPSGTRFSRR